MSDQAEYDSFVSKIHGMITFEMMREFDRLNVSMVFQEAQVPGPSFQEVLAKQETELATVNAAGRHVRVTFDKFMETSMLIPGNKLNNSAFMLIGPSAVSLAEAVEKHVKALKPLPFFAVNPPVIDEAHVIATKVTKIFGVLPVRSELCRDDEGQLSLTTAILYGSAV